MWSGPMKIFAFDPADYRSRYHEQNWLHVQQGMTSEFHAELEAFVNRSLSATKLDRFAIKGKKFELELLPGPAKVAPPVIAPPLGSVFYALRGADDAKNRDVWKQMLNGRGKRDLCHRAE